MSSPGSPLHNDFSTLPYLSNGDSESELSDVPTNIGLPASSSGHHDAETGSRLVKKTKRRRYSTSSSELSPMTKKRKVAVTKGDTDSDTNREETDVSDIEQVEIFPHDDSKFESLPNELLQKIAIDAATDQDLASLIATCRTVATAINSPESKTWKARFLAAYDYPYISASIQYCWAYKERTFVLRNFLYCHRMEPRISIQLRVLKEMVLESYRVERSTELAATSLNLQAGSDPRKADWLHTFLASPIFNMWYYRYGEPHMMFDSLQLTFSYLLLSPASPMAHAVSTGRDKYDVEKVYNWNQEFTILCTLCEDQSYTGNRRLTYAWQMRHQVRSLWPIFKLDMHSVLHIRNFWHRHLLGDGHTTAASAGFDENTYSTMANGLAVLGHVAGPWTASLPQWTTVSDGARVGKWYGHYSCIHPWPKTRKGLGDRQSCAEDWDKVDPLTLDFDAKESNIHSWPMIFDDVPAIKRTLPSQLDDPTIVYLRGIAPFLDMSPLRSSHEPISSPSNTKSNEDNTTDPRKVKFHPYKALRLRGFMHLLACPDSVYQHVGHIVDPEIPMPGFSRISFVLYKPTSRYLVQVLEHNMEDYGNPWTVHVGQQLQNQQVTVNVPINTGNANGQDELNVDANGAADNTATANVPMQAVVDGNALAHDPAQAEKILRLYLDDLLDGEHEDDEIFDNGKRVFTKNEDGVWDFATKRVKNFPADKMTRENINKMEEAYSNTKFLNWEDIEYAYAYEGIVTPGGKVMMGRWWRIGLNGVDVNDGYEVDCEGLGVKVVNGEAVVPNFDVEWDGQAAVMEEGRPKKSKGLERGPFVFWT